jgi:Xaa-Pro dipeptidase
MSAEPTRYDPTSEELDARTERVRAKMAEERLDWYVAFEPDNIRYLINFSFTPHERPFVLLIPARGPLKFVLPTFEKLHILKGCVGDIDVVEYFEFPAPEGQAWFDGVKRAVGGAARVGVESVCPLQVYEAIPAERVRTDIIDELRAVKSAFEVSRMKHAGRLVSAGMHDLLTNARVGRNVTEVGKSCQDLMLAMLTDEDPLSTPSMIKGGAWFQSPRCSDDPHDFSDRNMAMEAGGPHVSIINAVLRGYGSEVERTFFIGHVPEAAKRPYETMMRGRGLALKMARPGVLMGDIDKAVHALFRQEGYGDSPHHRIGHGMGMTAHEGPFLAEGDPHVLQPGMSFSVEPGIYVKGVGGFRHSDTVLVTETGNVLLTDAPDSLEALTLAG